MAMHLLPVVLSHGPLPPGQSGRLLTAHAHGSRAFAGNAACPALTVGALPGAMAAVELVLLCAGECSPAPQPRVAGQLPHPTTPGQSARPPGVSAQPHRRGGPAGGGCGAADVGVSVRRQQRVGVDVGVRRRRRQHADTCLRWHLRGRPRRRRFRPPPTEERLQAHLWTQHLAARAPGGGDPSNGPG